MPALSHNTMLLLFAFLGVIGLIVMVAFLRVNSFVALVIASLFVGITTGMPLPGVAVSFQAGVGKILGGIAMIVGFGTIVGKFLSESGGAEVVADRLIKIGGVKNIHWTMMALAYIIGVSVFFNVGFVILFPIFFTIARKTNLSLVYVGVPILAGLSSMHGMVPPHPGPMAAVKALNANTGLTIMFGLLIGLPTAMISGPMIGRFLAKNIQLEPSEMAKSLKPRDTSRVLPGFWTTILTMLLPVLLMMAATIADLVIHEDGLPKQLAMFFGNPLIAMLLGVFAAFWTFGFSRGFNKDQVLKFCDECLGPVAVVLLVVGAGGGFNQVLQDSGVGNAIAAVAKTTKLPPLFLGWVVACLIRIATGSATVAITAAAGIIAPIVAATPGTNVEVVIIAMGAGSLILSHVNDSGFWFVKEYFNMSVAQTLRTWTVVETTTATTGLIFCLILDQIVTFFHR